MSEIRFIIYRSDLNNLHTGPKKKTKKYQSVGNALSINDNSKNP